MSFILRTMVNVSGASQRLMYPVPEAAELLGIGRTKTFALMREGALRSVRVGRRRLVPADALDAYVAKLQGEPQHVDDAA